MAGVVNGSNSDVSDDETTSQVTMDNISRKDGDQELDSKKASVAKKSTCTSTSNNKIATEDEDDPISRYINSLPRSEMPLASPTSEDDKGPSVSRRGGGSKNAGGKFPRGGKSRRGGRGNDKKPTANYPDFHSFLFAPATPPNACNGIANVSELASTSTAKLNVKTNNDLQVVPGYLTRDKMIQLTASINNGFYYINNALELLKQSQLELVHAQQTLESVYKIQHGDVDLPAQSDDHSRDAEKGEEQAKNEFPKHESRTSLGASLEALNNAAANEPDVESFQLHLDPFQFVDATGVSGTPEFTVRRGGRGGRGAGRGGRGGRSGQRRKRQIKGEFSSYNSQLCRKGLKDLIKHLTTPVNSNGADIRQPIVILHDLLPVLNKNGEFKPTKHSASKIEASFKRHISKSETKTKLQSSGAQTSSKQEIMEIDQTKRDELKPPKKVSKIPIPPESEDNIASTNERKMPVPTANNSTDSPPAVRYSKSGKKLPHWRTWRVDAETLDRIKRRVDYELKLEGDARRLQLQQAASKSSIQTPLSNGDSPTNCLPPTTLTEKSSSNSLPIKVADSLVATPSGGCNDTDLKENSSMTLQKGNDIQHEKKTSPEKTEHKDNENLNDEEMNPDEVETSVEESDSAGKEDEEDEELFVPVKRQKKMA